MGTFVSTSAVKKKAEWFAKGDGKKYRIEIIPTSDTRCAEIWRYSSQPDEKEYLFPPGTKFEEDKTTKLERLKTKVGRLTKLVEFRNLTWREVPEERRDYASYS